jgi:hypothetical protein
MSTKQSYHIILLTILVLLLPVLSRQPLYSELDSIFKHNCKDYPSNYKSIVNNIHSKVDFSQESFALTELPTKLEILGFNAEERAHIIVDVDNNALESKTKYYSFTKIISKYEMEVVLALVMNTDRNQIQLLTFKSISQAQLLPKFTIVNLISNDEKISKTENLNVIEIPRSYTDQELDIVKQSMEFYSVQKIKEKLDEIIYNKESYSFDEHIYYLFNEELITGIFENYKTASRANSTLESQNIEILNKFQQNLTEIENETRINKYQNINKDNLQQIISKHLDINNNNYTIINKITDFNNEYSSYTSNIAFINKEKEFVFLQTFIIKNEINNFDLYLTEIKTENIMNFPNNLI